MHHAPSLPMIWVVLISYPLKSLWPFLFCIRRRKWKPIVFLTNTTEIHVTKVTKKWMLALLIMVLTSSSFTLKMHFWFFATYALLSVRLYPWASYFPFPKLYLNPYLLAYLEDGKEEGSGRDADPQNYRYMGRHQQIDFRYKLKDAWIRSICSTSYSRCSPVISMISSILFLCPPIKTHHSPSITNFNQSITFHWTSTLHPSYSLFVHLLSFVSVFVSVSFSFPFSPCLSLIVSLSLHPFFALRRAASTTYYNLLRRARRERVKVKCLLQEVEYFDVFRLDCPCVLILFSLFHMPIFFRTW